MEFQNAFFCISRSLDAMAVFYEGMIMTLLLRDWLDLLIKIYMYIYITYIPCMYRFFRCAKLTFFRGGITELSKEHEAGTPVPAFLATLPLHP